MFVYKDYYIKRYTFLLTLLLINFSGKIVYVFIKRYTKVYQGTLTSTFNGMRAGYR